MSDQMQTDEASPVVPEYEGDDEEERSALETFTHDFLNIDAEEPPGAAEIRRAFDAKRHMDLAIDNFCAGSNTWTWQNIEEKFKGAVQALHPEGDEEIEELPINEHFATMVLPYVSTIFIAKLNDILPEKLSITKHNIDNYMVQIARHMDADRFGQGYWKLINLVDLLDYAAGWKFAKELTLPEQDLLRGIAGSYLAAVNKNGGEAGVPEEIVQRKYEHVMNVLMGEYPFGYTREGERSHLELSLEFLLAPELGDLTTQKTLTPAHYRYLQTTARNRIKILEQGEPEKFTPEDWARIEHLKSIANGGELPFGFVVEQEAIDIGGGVTMRVAEDLEESVSSPPLSQESQ